MAHMNTVLVVMKGFDLAQMKAICGTNGMEKYGHVQEGAGSVVGEYVP